jgi:hypothetical protein
MSDLPSYLMASDTEPGFVDERCPHCGSRMYDDKQGAVLCLNACRLPAHLYRMLQNPVHFDQHFAGAATSEGDA